MSSGSPAGGGSRAAEPGISGCVGGIVGKEMQEKQSGEKETWGGHRCNSSA